LFIVYTAMSVHSQTTVFFVEITILKTIPARLRKVAVDSFSLENALLSISNVKIKVIQLFENTTYSILVSQVEIFRTYAFWHIGP